MTSGRALALLLACGFAVHALWLQPTKLLFIAFAWMLLPLTAICFGDELGSGRSFRFPNEGTPGVVLRGFGWLLLLTTPLVVLGAKARLDLPLP